jgi:hypothetical protein
LVDSVNDLLWHIFYSFLLLLKQQFPFIHWIGCNFYILFLLRKSDKKLSTHSHFVFNLNFVFLFLMLIGIIRCIVISFIIINIISYYYEKRSTRDHIHIIWLHSRPQSFLLFLFFFKSFFQYIISLISQLIFMPIV